MKINDIEKLVSDIDGDIFYDNFKPKKDDQKIFNIVFEEIEKYKANENLKLGFSYNFFAKLIIKNSKVKLIYIKNEENLKKFLKKTAYGEKIYIGMGAGSISNWMRNLKNNI